MSTGTVKWFNAHQGFGSIRVGRDGPDVLVHHAAIRTDGFRELQESQRVESDIAPGAKGPHADAVRPI
ncbi:cold-shock protein [Planosporangium sp. 12N6]|uniref:cold-shock protein n=1 Tax=Planosporangium spinosum TaxID=3402278 RepID=UPI003CEA06AD